MSGTSMQAMIAVLGLSAVACWIRWGN